jgi:nucleotide-binding universal stress UspA family protein
MRRSMPLTIDRGEFSDYNSEIRRFSMATFQNILVPTDFSDHSKAALESAIQIAKSLGSKIHVLHCYQIQVGGISPYGIALPSNYFDEIRKEASRQLNEWTDQVASDGIEVESSLSSEFPSQAIALAAEKFGSDLIVMGTRGLTGIKHVMLGSVAERTLRVAPCPVMTVKASTP